MAHGLLVVIALKYIVGLCLSILPGIYTDISSENMVPYMKISWITKINGNM